MSVVLWLMFAGAFLLGPIFLYAAGIRLYLVCFQAGIKHELATFICFITCVPMVAIATEVFYRLIDVPSAAVAKLAWAWLKQ
jgi:hypothetical protein